MLSAKDAITEVVSSPHAAPSIALVHVEIIELVVADFELFEGIVPLSMLADCSCHTELLIVVNVHAESAASSFRHPRWIDMGVEEFMVIILIFILQEQSFIDVLCVYTV